MRRTLSVLGCFAVGAALSGCGGDSNETSPVDLTTTPPTAVKAKAKNGLIAFSSGDPGSPEIHMIKPDGSDESALTHPGDIEAQAVWSPDGTKIAYVSDSAGEREIFAARLDGSAPTRVTSHTGDDVFPSWSPDGTKIAYTRIDGDKADIYVVSEAGGEPSRLTDNGRSLSPDWSPDGSRIAYAYGSDEEAEIYVMTPDGKNQTRLTENSVAEGAPSWSPDGLRIAWERSVDGGPYDIFVMSWDGSGVENVTQAPSDEGTPAWSPDGKRIVFTSDRIGSPQLFVAGVAGSSPGVIITSGLENATHPDWQPVTDATPSAPITKPAVSATTTTESQADPGKAVFLSAGCGACHTLADAGTTGVIGPDLDDAAPSEEAAIRRVTEGQGAMPSFRTTLSEQEITDVAAYVSAVTGS